MDSCPDLEIKASNDGRPLNANAVVMAKLRKERERLKSQGIRLKESSQQGKKAWSPRSHKRPSSNDRSRTRSPSHRRSEDSYTPRSQPQDGDDRAAPEGVDIVGADMQGENERGRRRSESISRSRSDSRSAEPGTGPEHTRRVVVNQAEGREDASSLLEMSNLPDLSCKGKGASQYLADLLNPSLKTLPDFNKEQGGEPVQKVWETGKAASFFLQIQNPVLAESAQRTLNGLEFCGNKLQVQSVPKEAETGA
ncbi:unnamed protein product [Effrenium voratum]|uniref:Uncharacterized protein n=1 Tax=Effrenium voratum TaxID=2562239 RepID=A0AA36JQ24_9DINO|nr:unnamed protein product [Effrenium voratum]CAJ1409111.1 unnamed protein product [Effrenium voratum]